MQFNKFFKNFGINYASSMQISSNNVDMRIRKSALHLLQNAAILLIQDILF
jgi:hypothetical protein